ncbi:MAG TPA: OmpH family outer membrane protein [Phycisphaerales bacterium]|nr:OmpH family outer membrane protein [Phycisphaerales bacterium]
MLKPNRRPLLIALCVAGAGLFGAAVAHSASPAPYAAAAPTAVAVVNLERLFENLTELKERNTQLETVRETYLTQVKELDAKAKSLEAELKEKIPASDRQKRAEKAAELTEARAILKVRTELLEGNMERKNAEIIRDLYDKSTKAIADFAAREGYDIVLLDDRSLELPESGTVNNINSVILSKRILFAKPGVDVTDRLVSQMNTEYASGARSGQ